jgi:pilus assembly protein Flp/PilA
MSDKLNVNLRRHPVDFLNKIFVHFQTTIKSEKGQTLVEYALLLVLIAIVVIAMLKGVGGNVNNAFNTVNSALTS